MIGISAKAEYAVRAVLYLAVKCAEKKQVRLDQISKAQKIPREFLIQVMADLTRSGIVQSHRGAQGGYMLRRMPKKVTLMDVIEVIDGSISEFRCKDKSFKQCLCSPKCVMCKVWKELIRKITAYLKRVNFQQLAVKCRGR